MKKICILGAHSYIGESFDAWVNNLDKDYVTYTMDTIDLDINTVDFEEYDSIYCVAGIAHRKIPEEESGIYYKVNTDLVSALAKKAKADGVKQFILLSSMSVYGKDVGVIHRDDIPDPVSHYGKSKLKADQYLDTLNDDNFKVCIIRPPMVYGNGCKGNYQTLRKFALQFPFFPKSYNQRSMIYIDNLSDFVVWLIDNDKSGYFYPQDTQYVQTSDMIKYVAKSNESHMLIIPLCGYIARVMPMSVFKKVFGSLVYDFHEDKVNPYTSLKETIELSEK